MKAESIIAMIATEYKIPISDIEVELISTLYNYTWTYEIRIEKHGLQFQLILKNEILNL